MRIILICLVIVTAIGFGVYKFTAFMSPTKKLEVVNTQTVTETPRQTAKTLDNAKLPEPELRYTVKQAIRDPLSETQEKNAVGQMSGFCRLTTGEKVLVQLKNGLVLDRGNLSAMGRNWARDTEGRVYRVSERQAQRAQSDGGGDRPAESDTRKLVYPTKTGLSRGHDSGEPVPSKIIPSTP